ncbi:hypothetical protein M8818_006653 [Zalaria obscura]|uniref:Uncharacterized protein n=1 Tax=Zalaria obscura TaxID=2024903 RepID=A0ACC3S5L6_9PEZI
MGNCCGKQDSEAFSKPGRTLGSAPPPQQPTTARVPPIVSSQGRTLGNGESSSEDPKAAAARAAEERAKAAQGKGKLGRQLDAQKARTHNDTLTQVSRENRAARDMDAAAETRNWQ